MTNEQFEALKRWIEAVTGVSAARNSTGSRIDNANADRDAAEQAAREAFCGKTWEQLRG